MGDADSVARTRYRTLLRLVLGSLAAATLIGVHRTVAEWSDRTGVFVSAIAVAMLLVALVWWGLSAFGPGLWRLLRSLVGTLWAAGARDPEVAAFAERHPRFSDWFRRRTTLESWRGLYLTVTSVAAGFFFIEFLLLARRALIMGPVTAYDARVTALLQAFRTPGVTRILWVFTVLGDPRVAIALTALVFGLLLLWGRRLEAALVVVTVAGGTLIGNLAKRLFERARPDMTSALIREPASFSLPSGHALYAMLFWGVLAFVLWRGMHGGFGRLSVIGIAIASTLLSGVSRVYLGVHWPSDVLASWLLALSWLSVCAGGYLMWARYGPPENRPALMPAVPRYTLTGVAAAAAIVAVVAGAAADPLLARAVARPTRVWDVSVDASGLPAPTAAQVEALPSVSERLDGTPQEPVGLIVIGTKAELLDAFERAGWSVADRPSLVTLAHALVAAYADEPYATAPVTPSFLGGRVHDIAFEKPAGRATVRRRHNVRWWRTDLTFSGEPVWVATASLDKRLEIGSAIPVIRHRIAPDVDAEQAYIARDLARVGARVVGRVQVSAPNAGTNAQGDSWFTQGRATLLVMGAR